MPYTPNAATWPKPASKPMRPRCLPSFFYLADPCAPIWRGDSLVVLTLRGNQVSVITRFGDRGRPRS